MRRRFSLGAVGLLVMLAACQVAPVSVPSIAPSSAGTAAPRPDGSSVAPPTPIQTVSEDLVAAAIEFRSTTGLQADEAWVRQVAADPRHVISFDVPLLPEELAELDGRPRDFEAIKAALQEYGAAHPGEFGGIHIEPPGGTHFVITFTGHLDDHRAALAKVLHPAAAIELRLVPTAVEDLDALMERISRDARGLSAEGIVVVEMARDEAAGVVEVRLSTERLDAEGRMAWLYGPNVVARVIDPTGAFLKPRGTITGRTVDPTGRGVPALVWPGPLFADLPRDSVGYEPNSDGNFRFPDELPGRWQILAELEGFASRTVEFDLPPGGVVDIEIVLTPSS